MDWKTVALMTVTMIMMAGKSHHCLEQQKYQMLYLTIRNVHTILIK